MESEIKFYTFTRKHVILARLNSTCFDVALLLAHFWSQFLTNFHKWPFVLKLGTCSFICTYCHDPIMLIMGPKRGRNGPKIWNINVWYWWQSILINILRPGWAVFPLPLAASNLVVHRPCWRWHKANNPFWTWI